MVVNNLHWHYKKPQVFSNPISGIGGFFNKNKDKGKTIIYMYIFKYKIAIMFKNYYEKTVQNPMTILIAHLEMENS